MDLDIAAGTGEPGLTIARLAPRGHVVLTDLSAPMLDIASRRADARGIITVISSFPDLAKAAAEFARVLKPGGRLCSSVWVRPAENPWTAIVMRAIAAEAVLAPPDPDGPDMFRFAYPLKCRDRLGSGSRKPSSPPPAPTNKTAR